jgi:ketosteroid isomerase-like protein
MKKLFFIALALLLFLGCKNETPAEPTEPTDAATPATEQQAEFADGKYTEIGKKAIAALASGDLDAWMDNYADNAKYYWNAGDSLVGKPAIDKFWRERRGNVIETLSFSNDIWMPIQVNKPQQNEQTGVWLLSWYQVTAKYKGGSSMTQWMHILYHFDANDKIDQVEHFVDSEPIRAAMPKKK